MGHRHRKNLARPLADLRGLHLGILPFARAESLKVLAMLEGGGLMSQHLLPEQRANVHDEATRYHGRRVDFADACLVVLNDAAPRLPIFTVDKDDFAVYLRGRRPRHLLTPA